MGPVLDDAVVLGDGRRAVDVIGEKHVARVELAHTEARCALVALVVAHVRRHVLQAAILGELDLRSRQPRLGAIDQVNDLLDLRGDCLRRCKVFDVPYVPASVTIAASSRAARRAARRRGMSPAHHGSAGGKKSSFPDRLLGRGSSRSGKDTDGVQRGGWKVIGKRATHLASRPACGRRVPASDGKMSPVCGTVVSARLKSPIAPSTVPSRVADQFSGSRTLEPNIKV